MAKHYKKKPQQKKPKKSGAGFKAVVIGIITVAIVGGGSVFVYGQYMKNKMDKVVNIDTIYQGISVDGTDVSGLTKQEALQKLQQQADMHLGNQKITIQQKEKNN